MPNHDESPAEDLEGVATIQRDFTRALHWTLHCPVPDAVQRNLEVLVDVPQLAEWLQRDAMFPLWYWIEFISRDFHLHDVRTLVGLKVETPLTPSQDTRLVYAVVLP